LCVYGDALDGFAEDQSLIEGAARRILGKSQGAGGISLRIGIDDEGALTGSSERGTEVYGCGRLADTALLIGDGNDSRQMEPPDSSANVTENFRGKQDVSRGTFESWSGGLAKMFHVEQFNGCGGENVPRGTF
jgi:hypothetical protein